MLKTLITICVLVMCSATKVANAQQLTAADERKRLAMHELLELNLVQQRVLDTLLVGYQRKFSEIDARLKAAERDPALSEDDVVLRMNVLTQEKADLREVRELDLKMLLTPMQRTIYEERIAPAKPQVLHFGIHNRMDCKICVE